MSTRIVDTHVHLWDRDTHPLPWFRKDLDLPPRVTAEDFRAAAVVDAAIAVQAADTLVEAEWLRDETARDARFARLVLQYTPVQGEWAGIVAPVLDARVAGIRAAVPQFAPDLSDVEGLDALANGLARTDRALEFLIRPTQLPGVAAFAGRHPDLRIVICHLGLGAAEPDAAWRAGIAQAGARANVHAKLSGIIAGRAVGRLGPIADAAFAAFGADRLLFGSDWPMSARALAHADVVDATAGMLAEGSLSERDAVWHGTAERVYAL